MNELIALIRINLDYDDNRFRFDGKFYHFYADNENVVADLRDVAKGTKHVYGVEAYTGCLSFRCDKARFTDQLIDLVLVSKGF